MKKLFIMTSVLVVSTFINASATIINVPDDYGTIQEGIDASSDGDTVLVQPDTYVENINFNGHNIVLGSLFLTTGDTSYISSTIIDGNSSGSVVTFESQEEITAVLTGFTLQNGLASSGGGINCLYNSSPTISNNTITGNSANNGGGGIECDNSNPFISNNMISENSANYPGGGGICCIASSPVINNNTISENSADWYGGGIFCDESSPTISSNTISGNSTDNLGGGICCLYNSSPTISNNTISGNSAGAGGGIFCRESSPTISSNTISGNSTDNLGGGICCYSNSSPTISNNTITGNSADVSGGGIYCYFANPTVSNNTISGNSTDVSGGGIYCLQSSPIINNNTITGNSANGYGGGIFCTYSSSPTISNNTISANSAFNGGGLFCQYLSSPTISNNTISGNSAAYGGGIYCASINSPTLSNNTISENAASWAGGGICYWNNSNPIIGNNTISRNSANIGGGIYCRESDAVVVNTIFWANLAEWGDNEIYLSGSSSISITYSDIQDTLWPGEGNIDADPLFCLSDTAYYRLAENSPCVGSGQNGENMGAFGIGCEATDIFENDFVLPMQFSLSQNYPNPFNPTTTITFSLPMQQHVTLMIYNLLGREVHTLVDEQRQAGMHAVMFDASGLSSGIYFYRLQAGDYSESRRMILLK